MHRVEIHTFEEIHHVCLMYGLKKAYGRFPFLAKNLAATPPPLRRSPQHLRPPIGFRRNPVNVQYFKNDIMVLYDVEKVSERESMAFAMAVVEEYLILRHPYMKTGWEETRLTECASGHLIAELTPKSPETDDMP